MRTCTGNPLLSYQCHCICVTPRVLQCEARPVLHWRDSPAHVCGGQEDRPGAGEGGGGGGGGGAAVSLQAAAIPGPGGPAQPGGSNASRRSEDSGQEGGRQSRGPGIAQEGIVVSPLSSLPVSSLCIFKASPLISIVNLCPDDLYNCSGGMA